MKKRFVYIAIFAAIIVSGLLIRNQMVTYSRQKALLKSLSKIDTAGMEPQVLKKLESLKENLDAKRKSADAWGLLAMNLDAHDLKKESIPIYKEAARLDPSDFRWPYFCAVVFSDMGSRESLQWFDKAAKIKSDYSPLYVRFGNALFEYGDADQAAQKYQQALAADPNSSHAHYGLAQLAFAKGDMKNSRADLQKAFELDPEFGDAYNLLVSVCRKMNDAACVQEAIAAAKSLPEKSPLPDPVYAQVAGEGVSSLWYRARGSDYMKQKNYAAAIQQFQKAIKIRSDTQTHEDLAQADYAAGHYDDAAAEYKEVIQKHPVAQNFYGLALVYARTGSFLEAQQYFQKAIEQKPDFAEAYFNLAVAYAKTGNLQDTIATLKKAVAVKPDYIQAHYHLALAYLAARDSASAEQEQQILQPLDAKAAAQLQMLIEQSKNSKIVSE